jgi:hypothetical protein
MAIRAHPVVKDIKDFVKIHRLSFYELLINNMKRS